MLISLSLSASLSWVTSSSLSECSVFKASSSSECLYSEVFKRSDSSLEFFSWISSRFFRVSSSKACLLALKAYSSLTCWSSEEALKIWSSKVLIEDLRASICWLFSLEHLCWITSVYSKSRTLLSRSWLLMVPRLSERTSSLSRLSYSSWSLVTALYSANSF